MGDWQYQISEETYDVFYQGKWVCEPIGIFSQHKTGNLYQYDEEREYLYAITQQEAESKIKTYEKSRRKKTKVDDSVELQE